MKINCACFTPNTARIDDILRLAEEYQVDGVIDVNLKFCCLYDTERLRMWSGRLKEKGIPVLGLETDYTDTDAEPAAHPHRRLPGDAGRITWTLPRWWGM